VADDRRLVGQRRRLRGGVLGEKRSMAMRAETMAE
jgi:hypothetical protein